MPIADWSRLALLAALTGAPALPAAAQEVPVDLELVLAVDISGSVDEVEALLQREGYMAALRHPDVIGAIQGGMFGRVAVAYVEWAGDYYQRTVLDWSLLDGADSAHAFADALAETPLSTAHWTSLSGAIDYAMTLFPSPFRASRRVIDISGDGFNNRGRSVTAARDEAVAAGVGINGLPILALEPDLDRYYYDIVIGGPGAFVIVAKDYETFADAILKKLITEIALSER